MTISKRRIFTSLCVQHGVSTIFGKTAKREAYDFYQTFQEKIIKLLLQEICKVKESFSLGNGRMVFNDNNKNLERERMLAEAHLFVLIVRQFVESGDPRGLMRLRERIIRQNSTDRATMVLVLALGIYVFPSLFRKNLRLLAPRTSEEFIGLPSTPWRIFSARRNTTLLGLALGVIPLFIGLLAEDLIGNYPWFPTLLIFITSIGFPLLMKVYSSTLLRLRSGRPMTRSVIRAEIIGQCLLYAGFAGIPALLGFLVSPGPTLAVLVAAGLAMIAVPIETIFLMNFLSQKGIKVDPEPFINALYDLNFYGGSYLALWVCDSLHLL
ncbi:MAG: hypothetical protein ACRCYY_09680 [Trueperaceae bacterium]